MAYVSIVQHKCTEHTFAGQKSSTENFFAEIFCVFLYVLMFLSTKHVIKCFTKVDTDAKNGPLGDKAPKTPKKALQKPIINVMDSAKSNETKVAAGNTKKQSHRVQSKEGEFKITQLVFKQLKEETEERTTTKMLKVKNRIHLSGVLLSTNLKTMEIEQMAEAPAAVKIIMATKLVVMYVVAC